MLDDITGSSMFQVLASIITGGAFVGWYREHRKTKQDAQKFSLEFMQKQSERIDKLVVEVADLKAANKLSSGELESSRLELARAHAEVIIEKAKVVEQEHEITRLKTALGEHGRNNA